MYNKKIIVLAAMAFVLAIYEAATVSAADNCNLTAPASCFTANNAAFDESKNHCNKENPKGSKIKITDQNIIDFLIQDGKTGYATNTFTNVLQLQSFLKEHPYTQTIINNNSFCSRNSFRDGLYGNCTKEVFDKYLEASCENDTNNSDTNTNNENTEPVSEIKISGVIKDSDTKEVITNIKLSTSTSPNEHEYDITDNNGTFELIAKTDKADAIYFTGNDQYEARSVKIDPKKENPYTIFLKKKPQTDSSSNTTKKDTNKLNWNESVLRPKFQTGANWQERAYSGDAGDITYWLQKFGGKITGLLSAIAVLIIAYNGFLITTAGSDEDSLGKAKTSIKWAIIGLIGLNFVYIIVKTVISIPF